MSVTTNSEFVETIVPLRERMELYDKTKPPTDQPKNDAADPAKALPQGFINAMKIREAVFVKEQGVPLENELDEEDPVSFFWVVYVSSAPKAKPNPVIIGTPPVTVSVEESNGKKKTSTKTPAGTIRMVPGPHKQPHPNGKWWSAVHQEPETYVKLGRLALVKPFRGMGLAKLLIESALTFIANFPRDIFDHPGKEHREWHTHALNFKGLVLVHAQTGVQKVWEKYGFEKDESMGIWMEEGIEHCGMWKRVDISTNPKNMPGVVRAPGSQS